MAVSALTMVAGGPAQTAEETFASVYEAWRSSVYRWSLRFSGGRAGWAEDLTHDVFIKLLTHLPRLDASVDLGGWLYRVTANLALTRLRRDRALTPRILRFFIEDEAHDDTPDLSLCLKEEASAALAALQSLPPKESVVLTMRVVDGKSQREIAAVLSMSEGYVSKLLTRAWEHVRAAGWEVADAGA